MKAEHRVFFIRKKQRKIMEIDFVDIVEDRLIWNGKYYYKYLLL